MVQARDRTEARRLLAQGDRGRDGLIARGLLAHPGRNEGAAPEALGRLARLGYGVIPGARGACAEQSRAMRRSHIVGATDMWTRGLGCALCVSAAAASFAACSGSQLPTAPGGMPQRSRILARASSIGAFSKATSSDLLYVSSDAAGVYEVYVFTYPQGQLVTTFTVSERPVGTCADTAGDIFITTQNTGGSGVIYEYSHGGTTPIQSLTDPGEAAGCAIDKTTGNLAVTNFYDSSNPSGPGPDVAIYVHAQGSPVVYSAPSYFANLSSCTYDGVGNLFVTGSGKSSDYFTLAEMPKGGSFRRISINEQIGGIGSEQAVQWHKESLAVTNVPGQGRGRTKVYQIAISGFSGTVTGTTTLSTHSINGRIASPYSWIRGKAIAVPIESGVGLWTYPGGRKIKHLDASGAISEAVSAL